MKFFTINHTGAYDTLKYKRIGIGDEKGKGEESILQIRGMQDMNQSTSRLWEFIRLKQMANINILPKRKYFS